MLQYRVSITVSAYWIRAVKGILKLTVCHYTPFFLSYYRCVDPTDDPFRTCFGCDDAAFSIRSRSANYYDYAYNFIDRQTGEQFQVTRQNRRLICQPGEAGGPRRCKLRVTRGMQLRKTTYGRVQQFVQSEQYLSNDDVDIIRRYLLYNII